MESTRTPFDLNQAIQHWRDQLGQSPALCRENLDELESHLRDSIANLQHRGLSADEAFLIAARRAGSDAALNREFGKINAPNVWMDRALWMLVGVQAFNLLLGLFNALANGTGVLGIKSLAALNFTPGPVYAGLLIAGTNLLGYACALLTLWWVLSRKSQNISDWMQQLSTNPRRISITMGIFVVMVLVPRVAQMYTGIIWVRLGALSGPQGHVIMGMTYGMAAAWLVESAALITLTLLLARRRWMTKTCA